MLNQNEITQQIFDSISIIVENRLAGLNYDKTIICTVVDDSNAKNNIYTVTDGSIKFEADGQGNKYNINDSVRVEIPSGDWKQTKYIQGKHSTENDLKPVTYVSPIDSILKLTDNLIKNFPTNLAKRSLRANQGPDLNKPTELKLCTINISDDVKNADIFNSIYLQAEFQTDLDQYQIRSGDYGLLLVLNSADGGTTQALKFSATEHMFGNPYAFKIYTTQAKTYELSATNWSEGISSITVYLYEDNNFTYYNDATQTIETFPKDGIDNVKINNIKVQNLVLGFGSQIYNIKDNEIKIYTDNTDTFTVAGQNPEDPEIKNFKLLWYNKTEDNKYIGFSDGKASDFTDKDNNTQNYLQYDEIKYRDLVKEDNRLLAQKSDDYCDDKLSLSIAADRIDIDKLVQSSAKIIQGELYRELRGLYKWTKNMFKEDESDTVIDDMLKTDEDANVNTSLSKLAVSLVENSKSLSAYYLEALKAAKDKQIIDNQIDNIHNGVLVPIQTVFTLFGYDYSSDELVLKAATDDSQDVFPTLKKLIEEKYVSYEDIYTSYKTRIDLLLKNKIFNNYKEINKLLGTGDNSNATQLTNLISGNYDAEYTYVSSSDNEEYNNRYCIYWYRENLTHTDPDGILPTGWERIASQDNKGLPSEDTSNPGYLQARAGAAACEITFNRYIQKEKIKAVLFYNHEQFESNILEFSNTTNVVDTSAIDKNGALYIEHYNSIDGKQSHSKDSYQLYDANGLLINAAETQYKRELRARFDGESGKDEQLIGATVYWYVPKNATLLEVFDSEVQDFYTDRVKEYYSLTAFKNACKRDLISNHASYLVQVNKHEDDGESSPEKAEWRVYVVSTTFNEYDKSYLTTNQLQGDQNTDKTKIYLVQDSSNPLVYKKYKYNETVDGEWEEDTSGTNVERFTKTSYGETKPNDIEAQLANPSIYKPGYNCYFKIIGAKVKVEPEDTDEVKVADTIFTYHIKDYYNQTFTQNTIYCQVVKDETNYYADKTFAFSSFGNSGTDYTLTLLPDLEQNVITIDHPLDINMTLYDYNNHKIDIPLTQENPFSWKGPSGYGEPTDLRTDSNNIIGVKIEVPSSENHNCYAGILECTIKNIEIKQLNNKKVNLTSYLPIPYSENLNSYIEGTTTIIYDSLGTNPYYYKTPYKLFNALQNTEIDDVVWSIEYYDADGVALTFNNETFDFTKASLISLNSDNTLQVPLIYISQDIYPVVIAKKDNTVLWAQPILIIQNRYASPMLNDWDGRLKIDEENNTIMSMMVGAGRKNNNNQFEGVLMGDVRTGTGDDATAIGLYGFHEGTQSFGFKIDGTAFLGKAGHGRIYMDGNNGFIASSNWLSSGGILNSDGTLGGSATLGMAIDLQNGHIDAYNFKLTSGNFILYSTGQNEYEIINTDWNDISNVILGVNKKFALTKDGDLYASNVNLSGVINAQAGGSIGGWEIGSNHLITKNYSLGTENSFHMYSGTGVVGTAGGHTITEDDTDNKWYLTIGQYFGVTNKGGVYAASGDIGPLSIEKDKIESFEEQTITENITDFSFSLNQTQRLYSSRLDGMNPSVAQQQTIELILSQYPKIRFVLNNTIKPNTFWGWNNNYETADRNGINWYELSMSLSYQETITFNWNKNAYYDNKIYGIVIFDENGYEVGKTTITWKNNYEFSAQKTSKYTFRIFTYAQASGFDNNINVTYKKRIPVFSITKAGFYGRFAGTEMETINCTHLFGMDKYNIFGKIPLKQPIVYREDESSQNIWRRDTIPLAGSDYAIVCAYINVNDEENSSYTFATGLSEVYSVTATAKDPGGGNLEKNSVVVTEITQSNKIKISWGSGMTVYDLYCIAIGKL